ncbi:outer membrane beta-barrel protein [Candidatus Eisenbacteria bacterium]|uniref:Outer membrane beta-barrel protein n=1 Tax=Eiseniibacteriota bacterium TaxID=2212470 RepID=A0ABV6YMT2_UNCEI
MSSKAILISSILVILLGAVLNTGASAEAIEDDKGFYLGLKFAGSSLHIEDDPDGEFFIKDDGGGVQLDIGYRFNPTFMLELSIGGANHETSDQAIDARFEIVQFLGYYRFSPQSAFRPYLKGGFSGNSLHIDTGSASWRVSGGGVAIGGGFKYFFSPHFSLGLDLTHSIIQYDSAEVGVEGFTYEWEIEENGAATALALQFGYSF